MIENKETLVKNYSFKELVDVKTLQSFTDTLYSAFRLPSAIVTTDGEILTGSGWQKICTDFHRKNSESEKDCIESDTCLTKMIGEGKKYCIYKCPRGLVDSSSPVIVDGVHVANVFTGQFFTTSPTKETEKLFREQAKTFGFDQKAYMEAFKSIPVFPEEKHLLLLDVLVNLASMLSEIGLARKRELDKTNQVLVSEEKFRKYISHAPHGIFIVDARGFYVEVNQAACRLTGYSESELTSMSIPDIVAFDDDKPPESLKSLKDLQKSGFIKLEFRLRRKDGTIIWASLEAVTISDDRFMAFCSDISERKLAEEAIRESEERLHQSQVIARVGDFIWDIPSGKATWSEGMYELLKFDKNEIIDFEKVNTAIHHPDDLERVTKWLTDNLASGQEILTPNEYRIVCKDGEVIHVQTNGRIDYRDGKAIKLFGTCINITERKLVEKKLTTTTTFLDRIVDMSPFAMWVSDSEGVMIRSNRSLRDTLGLTDEQLIGNYNVLRDENIVKQNLMPVVKSVFEKHEAVRFDMTWNVSDSGGVKFEESRNYHIDVSLFPVVDSDGKLVNIVCQWVDITERKQAEETIRENEEKLRTYISSAPDGIFIINSEAKFIEVNDTGCKIIGYSESELLQLSPIDVLDPEYIEKFKNNFDILKEKGSSKGEYKVITKSGKLIWLSIDAVALSEDEVMAFCSDISETKRLQELESRAERLETAGTIAGQVAHDFNNLLAPMVAYPEFIRDELPDDHPTLKYLDQIEQAAQKIADINQQLLTLGRRGHYNQDVINLNTIVNQAIMEMPRPADGVTREINLEPDLLNILGGGSQIHRVITNLLCNSADALQGIGHINIKTENYYADDVSGAYGRVPKGEYVKLTISDSGCGISDDIVQKILDPFFSTKISDKKRGSGLGLSVVDAVIKDHNGYLDLKTQSGKGTSFYIYFPTTRKLSNKEHPDKTIGGKETILIIDDDDMQREVSTKLLNKLGYKVNSVDSGEKAVKFLRKNPHELLILDMVMPGGIDGAETYRQILKISPNQKAIIVSGFSESDRVKVAQELGAGAFVKKPLTHKAIASAVRTELDRTNKTPT